MSEVELDNYEMVSVYHLDEDKKEELLSTGRECTFNWSTKDGWPMGVIMSYYWKDGRFWLTAGSHRHRISAVRRDPRVSIVVTSTGSAMGGGKTITAKGRCTVHESEEVKSWFYPEFARHLNPHSEEAAANFAEFLDSPIRIVLEVVPEKWITYDGEKMALDSVGKLPEERKGKPKESDAVRFAAEMKRRGLA